MAEAAARPKFTVTWFDAKREPENRFDPAHPEGVEIDLSEGAMVGCVVPLEWPAPRCGVHVVDCNTCGQKVVVTTAGRVDDPRSVKIACHGGGQR